MKEALKTTAGTHHSSLLDTVARFDDCVLLSRLAQEVRQLAVGALHSLALCSVCTVTTFLLQGKGQQTHWNCKHNKTQFAQRSGKFMVLVLGWRDG